MSDSLDHIVARLRRQISQAQPVLFVGAGFSVDAKNRSGNGVPGTDALAKALWGLAFPGHEFDSDASLGDVFYAAKTRHGRDTATLLKELLGVDPGTLPDFYRIWFSVPWMRCYTLNIDDLELAVSQAYSLPRGIASKSATSDVRQGDRSTGALEVVHLNGALGDSLDDLTLSEIDYATRSARPDTWLNIWSTDILIRPTVFVGTKLHESTLWQYVEYRKYRGGRELSEMRPGSILVTPNLDAARKALLKELNIDWVAMTAQQFAEEVLTALDAEIRVGHAVRSAQEESDERRRRPNSVGQLMERSRPASPDYLLGREPAWSDISEGIAVLRECDEELYQTAREILDGNAEQRPLVVMGTAASGKSTAIMRLAIRMWADGIGTYWIDEQSNVDPHGVRELVNESEGPIAIIVDDADLFGRAATLWARDLPQLRSGVLVALAARSTKFEGLLDAETLGLEPYQMTMPHLTDADINGLLAVLDRHNRLGILKGLEHEEQARALSKEAGRQLLVAMIKATSGRELRDKVHDEFAELPDSKKFIYAIVALVNSQRYTLDREELFIAVGRADNETLNTVEELVRANIIDRDDLYRNYRARHRYIADELINGAATRPYIGPVLSSVCFAFATQISDAMPRNARSWRRLIRFINHQYIMKIVAPSDGTKVYDRLEDVLRWDYHYWLQRGSLEVEDGDLERATNFLSQARAMSPGDAKVETAYAYLLMKKAAKNPNHAEAGSWLEEGWETLSVRAQTSGRMDAYPYHILGSQGLSWARHAPLTVVEKRRVLASLLKTLEEGVKYHPHAADIAKLHGDLKREWLGTTVESGT